MRKITMVAFAGFLGLAFAAPAQAQARYAASSRDVVEAERLEAEARALYTSPKQFRKAAQLHERAAELRPAGDLERARDLRQAARLYYYAGEGSAARRTMVAAGDAALEAGDVIAAAETYLDAAFLYREAGQADQRNELVRKAHLLSNSPLLSAQDRSAILSRIRVTA